MAIPVSRLGWMAGILDLKGRIYTKRNNARNTDQVVLTVDSKEVGIIRVLSGMTGTRPEMKEAKEIPEFMRRNCNEHCPEAHTHVSVEPVMLNRIGRWTITGAAMVTVLENVLPFLAVDRGYEEAIRTVVRSTVLQGQGAGMVFASLARLRDLGWDLPQVYAKALAAREEQAAEDGLRALLMAPDE